MWMPRFMQGQPGARRVDDRRVISGIIHVPRIGCRWEDCPSDYGPPTTVYNRFNRWSHRGLWGHTLALLARDIGPCGPAAERFGRHGRGRISTGPRSGI